MTHETPPPSGSHDEHPPGTGADGGVRSPAGGPGETDADAPSLTPGFVARASLGGALMGVANLVPGISGGTMLVAAGVYRAFIDAVSDVSRLRFGARTLAILAIVAASAIVAIGAFAGIIAHGLAEFRWGMYALFIGLTLGGAPVLTRMIRPFTNAAWAGMVAGIVGMVALVVMQWQGGAGASGGGTVGLILAGAAGASAMILPGVSGAYLLLLLGEYDRVVTAIKDLMRAGASADVQGVLDQMAVVVPVGIGVVVGIVVVSNALRFVLHRYEKATLGVLLGLLLAAPAGLYPFKEATAPEIGDEFKGAVVTAETIEEARDRSNAKDWPERFFTPGAVHIAGSAGLIALGFVATLGVSRLGRGQDEADTGDADA